jgi:hypothetical protein
MRLLIILLIAFNSIGLSQQNCTYSKKEIITLFKHINKTDQSNLKKPIIRHTDFLNNFDTIIHLMYCSDYEKYRKGYSYSSRQKKNIEHGVSRTITHIFQLAPEKILNDSIISLFKNQLNSSNLKKSILINALSIYRYDFKDDLDRLKKEYTKALTAWDIKE